MFKLKIDSREHSLITLCTNSNINFEHEQLDIGDIQITNNSDILLVFERKTIQDLYSSIRDGRYHEQKSRLMSNVDRCRICYIIEGEICKTKFMDPTMIFGSILNTMYRDKIHVYRSTGLTDTYNFIVALWERIKKDNNKWISYLENTEETNVSIDPKVYKLSSTKSKNITKKVVFINSLNNIPGCSSKIAESIFDIYKSMKNLINSFEESTNPELMLKDINLGSRKLGPVLSKRIYEFIMLED